MSIPNIEKVNSVFHKYLNELYNYATNNPEITKLIVFGNALNVNDYVDKDEEMHVAVYLNNPTPDKIDSISRYINDNIDKTWGCLIDDEKYEDSVLLKNAISKGVVVYDR